MSRHDTELRADPGSELLEDLTRATPPRRQFDPLWIAGGIIGLGVLTVGSLWLATSTQRAARHPVATTATTKAVGVTRPAVAAPPDPASTPAPPATHAPAPSAAPGPTAATRPPVAQPACPSGGPAAVITGIDSAQGPELAPGVPGFWNTIIRGELRNNGSFTVFLGIVKIDLQGVDRAPGIPTQAQAYFPDVAGSPPTLAPGASVSWATEATQTTARPSGATAKPDIWAWASRQYVNCPSGMAG